MKIFKSLDDVPKIVNPVVTVGTFDGVHVGHRKILDRLIQSTKDLGGTAVILTFFPHPRMVLYPNDNDLKMLNTVEEKARLLEEAGVDYLIVKPFTKEFSRMSSHEFVRDLLVNKLGLKKLILGYNHQFGRNREGTFEQVVELSKLYDFEVEEIPEQDVNHVAVSSTKIRKALNQGNIASANELLGYAYSLAGVVVRGEGVGKKLGFPTANLDLQDPYKLVPYDGIYAVDVLVEGLKKEGLLYIGKRPIMDGTAVSIEVNIFDFVEDVYGKRVQVAFVKKIRDDMNFQNFDLLIAQMMIDKNDALRIFKERG